MSDPLEDARLHVENAHKHIAEFKALLRAFLNNDAYTFSVDFDQTRRAYVHKVILRQPGRRLKMPAKSAWGDLRSALDHLNAACARLGGAGRLTDAHFPFTRRDIDLDAQIKRRCKFVPDPVKDYFKSLRPYQGGDDRLYALSSIRNSNEHWKLRQALIIVRAVKVTWRETRQSKIVDVSPVPQAINEIELFTSAEPTTNYYLELLMNVSFEDFEAFGPHAAEVALDIEARKVIEIIDHTEGILRSLDLI